MRERIKDLAKSGNFETLRSRWEREERFDLEVAFGRAVTDFRTVRRKAGHQQILEFCLDHGLEIDRHLVNLAAQNGNDRIIASMEEHGLPEDPFIDACLGTDPRVPRATLPDQADEHGSNLLHYCAGSHLARTDALTQVCRLLLREGVAADHVVMGALPDSPAFRCAAFGGNAGIMNLLLKSGQIDIAGLHLELEFCLEPHQRSGPPFYDVAETILAHGFDINAATGSHQPIWGVIDAWSKTDPAATAEWIGSQPRGRLRSVAYDRLMKTWSRHDPESAARFVLAVHGNGEPGPRFSRVLREWVASDFTAAARWVEAVPDPDLRASLRAELIGQSDYTSDRRETLKFALSHLAEDPDLLGSVIGDAWRLANKDPDAAREWAAENLTDTAQLAEFNDSILSSWIDGDPGAAALRLEEFGAGESHYRQAARDWARRDLAASKAWLEELGPGTMRDAATVGLAEGWLRENREAAGDWIASFPAGELRDQLSDRRARATMNVKDIQASIEIASEIREPFLRDQTYEDILKTWIRDEAKAEAAREFTENTDLISETVRWRVLNRPWGHP